LIVYLDASALVKQYVSERGSEETNQLVGDAEAIGTSVLSRAEVSAALAKAMRLQLLSKEDATAAVQIFRAQWPNLLRIRVTETLIAQADAISWDYSLRGYDAVHLSAALLWQETLGEPIQLATFDRQLWKAGQSAGVVVWPDDVNKFAERS
jgi:predicted nucleic acid-binding protein